MMHVNVITIKTQM